MIEALRALQARPRSADVLGDLLPATGSISPDQPVAVAGLCSSGRRGVVRLGGSHIRANQGALLCSLVCRHAGAPRTDDVPAQRCARVARVRLEPLYRIRFGYPEGWVISLGSEWEQHFYIAEGRCDGEISGRFRGANYPRRRHDGTFRPDFRAVIETDDGATIMFEWHGYGRAIPVGRRQIVGAIFHSSDDDRYKRLNDVVCVCVGEVRASSEAAPELVIDIAELIWEAVSD